MSWIRCPEEGCSYDARITDETFHNGAPVPAKIVTTVCPDGHVFRGATNSPSMKR